MVQEALETWLIPVVALAAAALFASLAGMDVWPQSLGVLGVGASLLVLVLFAAFRGYVFGADPLRRNASLGFCAVWFLLLLASFYDHVFPGPPIAAGALHPGGESVDVPGPGLRAIVVDGRFVTGEGQGNRLGHYRLEASEDRGAPRVLEGDFEDSFARQRVGRRGSATVEIQHTSQRHLLRVGERARLHLVEIDKSLEPVLSVEAYRAASPWLLSLLGVVGIVAALVMEKWFDGDGTALMAVAVSFFVVDQYERWGAPHPQMKSLIGAILVGSFIGAPLAAIAWRVVPRRWIVHAR